MSTRLLIFSIITILQFTLGQFGYGNQLNGSTKQQIDTDSLQSTFDLTYHKLRCSFFDLYEEPEFYVVYSAIGISPFLFESNFDYESTSNNRKLEDSKIPGFAFDLGRLYGNSLSQLSLSAAILIIGDKRKNQKLIRLGSDLFVAQVLSQVNTAFLKHAVKRTRPNGNQYSYPSGHASSAFASSWVIADHLGWKAGVPAYLVSVLTCLSRLRDNVHYTTDVAAGALLGTYIAHRITRGKPESNRQFSMQIINSKNVTGLGLTVNF